MQNIASGIQDIQSFHELGYIKKADDSPWQLVTEVLSSPFKGVKKLTCYNWLIYCLSTMHKLIQS